MGHDILMMDNPVNSLNLVIEMLGQVDISDPWTTVMMDLHFQAGEDAFQFQGCDLSQGAS